ncbi:short chain dehydrogenase [Brucella pseudogrignonensis]|uniref:short chain dehydrogenase n=1 Tax=Brucella pseudogrignonensis TaxID=419475 RepID=UPI0028B45B55|nr:short chain dehydrogenase [Brucella pseudogrignonensis]MDT6942554.1 short chain dehydrogenase [Brucella pseudogrignonensis]
MKTVILIGASGKMGKAARSGLEHHKVVTASQTGEGCDYAVDITSRASLSELYAKVGTFDAVVSAVGHCEYGPFEDLTEDQWLTSANSKLLGQVNVVNAGLKFISDGGSFTLISGIHNIKPVPTSITDSTLSGAIDTFVRCVAYELPRGIRINSVNPTVLEESWSVYGEMLPGFEPVPGKRVGKAFQRSVDGFITGEVLFVDV